MQSTEMSPIPIAEFSLVELTEILIREKGIHEGLYNLSIQFQIAVGAVGPSPDLIPGAMVGVKGIGLSKTEKEKANDQTVDAAKVNPAPKKKKKKK